MRVLNWEMMTNPANWVIVTLMVLIALMGFNEFEKWRKAP